jgi:hypothetical protein
MTQRRKTHRRILHRLALASLAALCIGAPVASAGPIDPVGTGTTTTQDPRQQDMHASTVQKSDAVGVVRDARGESAAGGGTTDKVVVVRDARGESAVGGGTTGGTAGGPVREPRVQGPPTWPENPTSLPQPEQQPVASGDGDDIGIDLPVALLILAGTLALGGGLAVAGMKARAHTTHAAH